VHLLDLKLLHGYPKELWVALEELLVHKHDHILQEEIRGAALEVVLNLVVDAALVAE